VIRAIAEYRHLKRVRPVPKTNFLQVLIETPIEMLQNMSEVTVPSREPLSRQEWAESNKIWPLRLPNVIETSKLID
jgi:hypothetical protein